MAQAPADYVPYKTPNGLEIQFLVSDILHVDADGIVAGQGPVFDQTSLVTEHLLRFIPEFSRKREQLRKSEMWSVHKTALSDDSRHVKWILTCFFNTHHDGLTKKMSSLYRKILEKADKHITNLAMPLLSSGRGGLDEADAGHCLLIELFHFKPVKFLRAVKIVHGEKEVIDMILAQCQSMQGHRFSHKTWLQKTLSKKDTTKKTGLSDIDWRNEVIFRPKASTNPSMTKPKPKTVNVQTTTQGSINTQQTSTANVPTTTQGSINTPQKSTVNVSTTKPRYMAAHHSSNANVQPVMSSDKNTNAQSSITRPNTDKTILYLRTGEYDDDIQQASGDTNKENTEDGITQARPNRDSDLDEHGATGYIQSTHGDPKVVKTRPPSAVLPRRRKKDRFKVEGDMPKPSEREKIEEDFRSQFGESIGVFNIRSVENEDQKRQFEIKRKQILTRLAMDYVDLWEVQKTLWFHTSKDLVDFVSKHGFNRNVCRSDGEYGEGVYFTNSPVPSLHLSSILRHQGANHTLADLQETKYMFRANVLTGKSKLGSRGIRVLEDTEDDGLHDCTVDDLQSPSVYVVYNDTQAYPDYLIEYTLRVEEYV